MVLLDPLDKLTFAIRQVSVEVKFSSLKAPQRVTDVPRELQTRLICRNQVIT